MTIPFKGGYYSTESWSYCRAMLRDWDVRLVRAGCYSWAALSLIDSKIRCCFSTFTEHTKIPPLSERTTCSWACYSLPPLLTPFPDLVQFSPTALYFTKERGKAKLIGGPVVKEPAAFAWAQGGGEWTPRRGRKRGFGAEAPRFILSIPF